MQLLANFNWTLFIFCCVLKQVYLSFACSSVFRYIAEKFSTI